MIFMYIIVTALARPGKLLTYPAHPTPIAINAPLAYTTHPIALSHSASYIAPLSYAAPYAYNIKNPIAYSIPAATIL